MPRALGPSAWRRVALATALGFTAAVLPSASRPLALVVPMLLIASVSVASRQQGDGIGTALLRVLIGGGPAVVIVGSVHDVFEIDPPIAVSLLLLLVVWTAAARTLGASSVAALRDSAARRDVLIRMAAVGGVTTFVAGAMVRLLLAPSTTVERLAWILSEEDNAHVVGVAREVLTEGPRGLQLAEQYGTAFINLPLLLARAVGGLPSAEQDPRLQAITLFTVSTLVIIMLAGLAMALITALPHHVHPARGRSPIGLPSTLIVAAGTTVSTMIGMALLVVLPMRTGFLTFVWGLTFVLLGAAAVVALPSDAPPGARLVTVAHLVSLSILLLSSWPFILPALGGLLIVPLLWVRWGRVAAGLRRHPARWAAGSTIAVAGLGGLGLLFIRRGPVAEVLSYGEVILTASASSIVADATLRRSAFLAVAVAVIATAIAARGRAALVPVLAIIGPVVGAGALYGGLRLAAALLTDGELNYSGVKLLYGIIVLAAVLGLLTVMSRAGEANLASSLAATISAVAILQASTTAALIGDWWPRTDLGAPPHAVATVEAIGSTSPNLPIRCLPAPGTVVTVTSQWAAYMCVRWMEDAFNEGRFHGHRTTL